MNFLQTFFRATQDRSPLEFFGPVHLAIILLAFGGAFLILYRRKQLVSSGWAARGAQISAYVLLIFQLIKYAWDIGSGHFSLAESLPLYPCRIAVWLLIIATLWKKEACWPLGFAWGLLGFVVSNILADPYPYAWPHFTNLEFFVTHIFMGWLILFRILRDRPSFSQQTLRSLLTSTNLFLIAAVITNFLLKMQGITEVNYAYLNQAPEFMQSFLPRGPIYSILLVMIYNLVVYLIFVMAKVICEHYYERDVLHATN